MKKILCIDDSNTALLLMEFALEDAGFQTILATSVDEAVSLINEQKPDMILLDLSMPEVSGFDFLKMRKSLKIEDVPVMVISAYDSKESIESTQNLGAVAFIAKPIKVDVIIEKIKTLLNH